jgi:hypothetical protein
MYRIMKTLMPQFSSSPDGEPALEGCRPGAAPRRRTPVIKRRTLRAVAAAAGVLALAAAASPALGASDSTLTLSGPTSGAVGQPLVFQAAGINPSITQYPYASFWLSVGVISSGVVPACPADRSDAIQLAITTGGEVPVFSRREEVDWNGSFSQTIGYTPRLSGPWLVCAYTTDSTLGTLAVAAASLDVNAAAPTPSPPPAGPSTPAAAKPANTKPPRVTRSRGKLVCNPGRWSNATDDYAFRWSVDGKRRKGAEGRKFRLTRRLRGHRVACSVTASNAAGSTSAVSRAVRVS